jgi:hypothetical protein
MGWYYKVFWYFREILGNKWLEFLITGPEVPGLIPGASKLSEK